MTISSTTRVAGPFTGSGSTATFPFTFKVFATTDLYVTITTTATDTVTDLALTTDYSVALNADQDTSPGGTITLVAGSLASGLTLTITTDIPALQGLNLANGGAFYPDVINAAQDRLTVLIQQLEDQISNRCDLRLRLCAGAVPGTAYTAPGTVVAVFRNGVVLRPATDYTLSDGTAITLINPTQTGDSIYALCIVS
jgi:hypothetical protein